MISLVSRGSIPSMPETSSNRSSTISVNAVRFNRRPWWSMTHVISLCDSDVVRCFTEWFEPVLRYGDHPLKMDQGQQVNDVFTVINRLERRNHG